MSASKPQSLGMAAGWIALFWIVVSASLAVGGCRSQPLIQPSPIHSPLGAEQNREAILRGLAVHRWMPVAESPGQVTAKLEKQGKHTAVVDIRYDAQTISVRYASSTGLRCEQAGDSCVSIHRAYNRWVVQLAKDLEYQVQLARLESLRAPPVGAE